MTIDIETESAGTFADANEADLHRIVSLMSEDNSYVIIHRDGVDQFAQAALQRRPDTTFAGGYIVEYSLKSGKLRQTEVETTERVYELLAGWAFDRPGWKAGESWKPLDDLAIDFIGNCIFEDVGGQVRVTFPPLGLEAFGPTREIATSAMREALQFATAESEDNSRLFSEWAKDHVVRTTKAKS